MDILDVLEEIRDVNAQNEGVSFEQLIDKHLEREKNEIEDEEQIDDALAKYVAVVCLYSRVPCLYSCL